MNFTKRVVIINVVTLVVAIAITSWFTFLNVDVELKRQASVSQDHVLRTFWELLRAKGSDFTIQNGKLMAGNYVVNGNFELPDKIREIFGGTATIFMGDTRVTTNVLKADGTRAVDTKLEGPAFDAVFREGRSYRGEAMILGVPYFTAYDPIKNGKGEVIGVLYAGIKKDDFFTAYGEIQEQIVMIAVLVAAGMAALGTFITLRSFGSIFAKIPSIAENINYHASSISDTMDRQSGYSTRLSSSVVEISSTMEEFSSTATQIAQHSQRVVERADRTLEDTKNGAKEVENLNFKVNDISTNIQANLEEIVDLGRKSKEINKVMEIINNIANQTKLIAFNAALEAASAGDAGKRFGVVAVEIRRLADSVVESTSEIEGKITEILDSVNRLVMSSERSFQLIQEGQEYAAHTVAMLIESVDGVEETTSAARQISLSTQQQQIASNQVVLALKDIETGVRAATETILQTNKLTAELNDVSRELNQFVEIFSVASAGEAGRGAKNREAAG